MRSSVLLCFAALSTGPQRVWWFHIVVVNDLIKWNGRASAVKDLHLSTWHSVYSDQTQNVVAVLFVVHWILRCNHTSASVAYCASSGDPTACPLITYLIQLDPAIWLLSLPCAGNGMWNGNVGGGHLIFKSVLLHEYLISFTIVLWISNIYCSNLKNI